MEERFWLQRWKKNEIGFHKDEPHHDLIRFFPLLQCRPGDTVFVPLCGKSLDMLWLKEQGVEVVGVELSRQAVDAFIDENQLVGDWSTAAGMPCWLGQGCKIFCGDFFRLAPDDLCGARAVYDRGALVALPEEMRRRYADHLTRLMPTGSRALAISYEYDQSETSGPPFSVPLPEIHDLYAADFTIELLTEADTLWSHQGLAARGVSKLAEFVVLMTRK